MNLKVACLLLLVFASSVTATVMTFSVPAPFAFHVLGSVTAVSNSLVKPLGDPIDGPGHPF